MILKKVQTDQILRETEIKTMLILRMPSIKEKGSRFTADPVKIPSRSREQPESASP